MTLAFISFTFLESLLFDLLVSAFTAIHSDSDITIAVDACFKRTFRTASVTIYLVNGDFYVSRDSLAHAFTPLKTSRLSASVITAKSAAS